MPGVNEKAGNALPTPSAVPSAVYEGISAHGHTSESEANGSTSFDGVEIVFAGCGATAL